MFPIHTKNSIVLPNVNTPDRVQSVLSTIEKELRSVRARKVQIDGKSIAFRGGILRLVSNWNLLVGITKGRISVHLEPNVVKVDYELWFTELLVAAIAMSCFFGVAGRIYLRQAPGVAVCVGLLAFTFFFGLNMLFAKLGFRAFLKECAEQSGSSMP
jgi:hypothetical protein